MKIALLRHVISFLLFFTNIRYGQKTQKKRASAGLFQRSCQLICIVMILSSFLFWGQDNAYAEDQPSDITELSIEELMKIEVVYAASKFEQKVTEAPSSVSITTADEIKKYGYRTLSDILRSVRGFYVSYDRINNYVGVRGFSRPGDYNTRMLLLVDGHRTNDNIYDSAAIDTGFILDVDLIDRIEIIRGPSSSLYGTNAFFGVINVITKRGHNLNGVEVTGEAGSFDTYKSRITYGNKFQNGLEMTFSGSLSDSRGQSLYYKEFDSPAANNGITKGNDYSQYYNLFTTLSLHDFTLYGGYVSREKGLPTAPWGSDFTDRRNQIIDNRGYVELKYEHVFPNQFKTMAKVFYDNYEYKGSYVYSNALYKDRATGNWWGGEVKLTKNLFDSHTLIIGGEYQDNFQQDQWYYIEEPYQQFINDKRDSDILALYIQDEYKILKNLLINAGIRYDYYSTFGGTTNPRLALIYKPLEKTTLKLLYGDAFRAPNTYELYYHDGMITQKPGSDLKPETIRTYEIALEQYMGDHLRGGVSGFFYQIDDLITLQIEPSDGLLIYKNIDEVESKGVEFELEAKWTADIKGRASYTYQEAKDRATDEILTNSPKHLAKLNVTIPLIKKKLFLGLEEQYTSKRKTVAGDFTNEFFVTNLTLFSQNLLKGLELSASVYNLFDSKYYDPVSNEHSMNAVEQDGISFRFKLTYRF